MAAVSKSARGQGSIDCAAERKHNFQDEPIVLKACRCYFFHYKVQTLQNSFLITGCKRMKYNWRFYSRIEQFLFFSEGTLRKFYLFLDFFFFLPLKSLFAKDLKLHTVAIRKKTSIIHEVLLMNLFASLFLCHYFESCIMSLPVVLPVVSRYLPALQELFLQ